MTHAIRFHKAGGPEVLQLDEIQVGDPGHGEVRIRHTAIGVNFVDTYQRSGLYPVQVPAVAGNEGAGVVEAVGPGVNDLKKGDRVAYTGLPGSYCDVRIVPADRMVKLPNGISEEQAASMMLKGLTVHYLIFSSYKVKKGDTVLWHAAAGGVGLIACQWLKKLGVTGIGTVGSEEKAKLAKAHGCEARHQLQHRELRREGQGAHQGQEGSDRLRRIGKTPATSLDCLQPRGLMVSFGNASGAVAPVNSASCAEGLALPHAADARHLSPSAPTWWRSNDLFNVVSSTKVKIETSKNYPPKRGAGAPRPRGPADHGIDGAGGVRTSCSDATTFSLIPRSAVRLRYERLLNSDMPRQGIVVVLPCLVRKVDVHWV